MSTTARPRPYPPEPEISVSPFALIWGIFGETPDTRSNDSMSTDRTAPPPLWLKPGTPERAAYLEGLTKAWGWAPDARA